MTSLDNKVILVTGASSGLGRATALMCATRGAKVFGVGRDENALQALTNNKSFPAGTIKTGVYDLSTAHACKSAVADCLTAFGSLDVLINVAGKHHFRSLENITEEDWQEDIAINLSAPFFLSQAAMPELLKNKGNIINVASIAGLQGQAYSTGYCAAKHGIIGLTRALAMEYTKAELRVNAICPGGMDTPQVQNMAIPENVDFDLLMRSAAPRGMMNADEVAAFICFIASDEASAIHGAVYPIDRGKTVG